MQSVTCPTDADYLVLALPKGWTSTDTLPVWATGSDVHWYVSSIAQDGSSAFIRPCDGGQTQVSCVTITKGVRSVYSCIVTSSAPKQTLEGGHEFTDDSLPSFLEFEVSEFVQLAPLVLGEPSIPVATVPVIKR